MSVVAAFFTGLRVRALLEKSQDVEARIQFVDERSSFAQLVASMRPHAVFLPPADANGVPSAPMIERLRLEVPDIHIVVLAHTSESSREIASAIRCGAQIAVLGEQRDLRAVFAGLGRSGHLAARERHAIRALVAELDPAALVDILLQCARHAHRAMSVSDLSHLIGIPRRTLSRRARSAGWPPPAELIEWGRLLRASVMQWRESSSLIALARASGFVTASSLTLAARRRLGLMDVSARDLSPLPVSTALRRRLTALARQREPPR